MYNFIEYSDHYPKAFGVLWQYCRDKPALNNANDNTANFNADNAATNQFKIKYKITIKTGNNGTKDTGIAVPLKYGSNYQRTLEIPLIDCEINLDRSWSPNCVAVATNKANQGTTISITDKKLCVPVTL